MGGAPVFNGTPNRPAKPPFSARRHSQGLRAEVRTNWCRTLPQFPASVVTRSSYKRSHMQPEIQVWSIDQFVPYTETRAERLSG